VEERTADPLRCDNKKSKSGKTRKQKRESTCCRCCDRLGCGLGRDEGDALHNVEAGTAKELVDDRLGEARCVVLYADGFIGFVEHDTADAVDLANAAQRHGSGFSGRGEVAVHYVKLCHVMILPALGKTGLRQQLQGKRKRYVSVDAGFSPLTPWRFHCVRCALCVSPFVAPGFDDGVAQSGGELFQEVHNFRAGPVLRADELAADNARLVDDVGFWGAEGVELGVRALGAVENAEKLDVVTDEEAAVGVGVRIHADGDDLDLR